MNLFGNIRDVDLTSVLQSINLCKMVGKLEVNDTLKGAELYFDDGVLVHAVGQQSVLDENSKYSGEGVLLDLLTWDQGSFKFHSGLKSSERSVARRMEALLMEGAALRDYSKWLAERGFRMDMPMIRVHPQLTESQFEQIVKQGVQIDLGAQKAVYLQIGNGFTMDQILQQMQMPKTMWMPIIFNLVNCQIIKLEEGAVQRAPRASTAVQLDYAAMEMAYHELLRPETGMLSYPLFLFFLTQEFARYKKSGMPFSVAIFELKQKRNGVAELLSNEALRGLAAFLERSMQGDLVLVSHFGIVDFAMLLPCSIGIEAEQMGEKLLGMLHAIELEGVDPSQLQFAIGAACVPDDCEDVETLLNLAVQRRRQVT
jgi:GGDEF domain-containing protein